jgi:hypothetical protein
MTAPASATLVRDNATAPSSRSCHASSRREPRIERATLSLDVDTRMSMFCYRAIANFISIVPRRLELRI